MSFILLLIAALSPITTVVQTRLADTLNIEEVV